MRRDEQQMDYAGVGVRLFAWLTDMAILMIPLAGIRTLKTVLFFTNPMGPLVRSVLFRFSVLDILMYVITALYFVLTTYLWGGTPGKYWLRLRVVSAEGRDLSLWDVVVREVIGRYLSGVVFMLGYIGILIDAEKRGVHDFIADTRVVYVQKAPYSGSAEPATPAEPPVLTEASAPPEPPEVFTFET